MLERATAELKVAALVISAVGVAAAAVVGDGGDDVEAVVTNADRFPINVETTGLFCEE